MPKEFDVTIVETLKMKVTVEADSLEEAEQLVSDGWYRGEYILDAEFLKAWSLNRQSR